MAHSDFAQFLIGAKIVSLTDKALTVSKKGRSFRFDFIDDDGDCCGYNEITTNLVIKDENVPAIVRVIESDTTDNENIEGSYYNLFLFGESKKIAEIQTFSYSGSGWGYGANVRVKCKLAGIDQTLSCW